MMISKLASKAFLVSVLFYLPIVARAQSYGISAIPAAETTESFDAFSGASHNGSVIGAETYNVNPAIYSSASGWQLLPYSTGYDSTTDQSGGVTGVSADGSVAVGITYGLIGGNPGYTNGYWIQGGAENLIPFATGIDGVYAGNAQLSTAISSDGSTVLQSAFSYGLGSLQAGDYAVLYNISSQKSVNLGCLNATYPYTYGTVINSNGTTVAGLSWNAAGTAYDAFLWTAAKGIQDIGVPSAYPSTSEVVPTCMSSDGSKIYGKFSDPASGWHAFEWTAATGFKVLSFFYPTSCTADGDLVVGIDPNMSTYVIWSEGLGAQYLSTVLTAHGVDLTDWTLTYYSDPVISGDGTTIACTAYNTTNGYSNVEVTLPIGLSSLTLSPSSVEGGSPTTGTLTLRGQTPAGGLTINLTSQIPSYVGVPASVTIPAGQTEATFSVTSKVFRQSYTDLITAVDPLTPQTSTLTVIEDSITSISLAPSTVLGGTPSMGTVNLLTPAPSGGWTVHLSSSIPSYVGVPTSVLIPTGSSVGTFSITTRPFRQDYSVVVTATDVASSKSATLSVLGDSVATVAFSPSTVLGGNSSTGTVTLLSAAPSGGWTVHLSSSIPSYVSVPSSITIPAGSSTGTFTATTKIFRQNYSVAVTASDATSSISGTLSVIGESISSVTLSPSSVFGGTSSTGTVTLLQAAPSGGWTVSLTSQIPSYVGVPASITIPAGSTSGTFTVTTKIFRQTYTNLITAVDATSSKTATLTVTGESVQSLTLSPSSVVGGNGSVGTITLYAPAPAGGWTVNLASQIPDYVGVPASITIPAGSTTGTFSITTKPFRADYTNVITATDATVSKTATLTVSTS